MLIKRKHGTRMEWCLVSTKDPSKILKWFGVKKPSNDVVGKEEARVEYFKNMKKGKK
jgi:hypothetical protein